MIPYGNTVKQRRGGISTSIRVECDAMPPDRPAASQFGVFTRKTFWKTYLHVTKLIKTHKTVQTGEKKPADSHTTERKCDEKAI